MSGKSMKLLGFMFGDEPNVSAHVWEIKRKFRARFWSLIHLRRVGFRGHELVKIYQVFIRPVIEFCGVVYHAMLTINQSNELERLQKQVFKLAYGKQKSYATICEEYNYATLKERRETYLDKFVNKAMQNERFSGHWFPMRESNGGHELRNTRIYHEARARTKRYYESTLALMRQRANYMKLDAPRNYT